MARAGNPVLPALGALILGFGTSTVLAASNPAIDDCPTARDADSDAAAALDLSFDLAPDAGDELDPLDRLEPAIDRNPGAAPDSMAPLLYLGPRVETIVRDVFGDERDQGSGQESLGSAPMAPLADSGDDESPLTGDDGEGSADDGTYSPLSIHREMYRTDI